MCQAGIDSLKIEGRAKTFYYVASVTSAYRRALDAYLKDPYNENFTLPDDVIDELDRTSHRHYSPGFYFGKEQALQTPSHTYVRNWDFIGTVDAGKTALPAAPSAVAFCWGTPSRRCSRTAPSSPSRRSGSKTRRGSRWTPRPTR